MFSFQLSIFQQKCIVNVYFFYYDLLFYCVVFYTIETFYSSNLNCNIVFKLKRPLAIYINARIPSIQLRLISSVVHTFYSLHIIFQNSK